MKELSTEQKAQKYDLLLSKMNEIGYEWNADKKEVKKIERNN